MSWMIQKIEANLPKAHGNQSNRTQDHGHGLQVFSALVSLLKSESNCEHYGWFPSSVGREDCHI